MRAAALAGCLALSGPAVLSFAGARGVQTVDDPPEPPREDPGQHLAVIVPVYRGDLSRAVSSLERWPSTCSSLTERNADLVLYYAEGEEDAPTVNAAVDTIRETAGHCFAETRLVYAHLSEEEDVYPKGPSVMFFKMFLDEGVHADLSEYDALAIIEWDVLVASDRSFEELHHAAFRGNEDFWVKGSNLGGTNFHSTAQASDMWNVLGHINGNAIYNNNDPAFVEYVDYTRARWEYTYPYDVALWLTISDFPYSWPLWQRYSSKFVTTNLISYVGYEHVDHSTVSDAVAGQTLFIHGSSVDEGNLKSLKATKHERKKTLASSRRLSADTETSPPACNAVCGSGDAAGLPTGTSTVCDDTCAGGCPRFGGFLCGAGDSDTFGSMCRLCYVDVEEARRQEQSLALTRWGRESGQEASHVVMCETMRPPEASECSSKCDRKKDTVCDESCGTGRHGDYNCNWRDHGPKCRFCFNDLETALMADKVAQRRGGRVIMCSTFEPPQTKEPKPDVLQIESRREENVPTAGVKVESLTQITPSRELQATCDEENCPHTNSNGFRGRFCDATCADGIPNGMNGCGAREGRHGELCRLCYNDVDRALANDDPDDRAIMCDTMLPVEEVPPATPTCDEEDCPHMNSNGFRGRFCDPTCADGDPFGTNGCGAREGRFGELCRLCYFDMDRAIANDDPENRAFMCTTELPVGIYPNRRLSPVVKDSAPRIGKKLKTWKDSLAVAEDVYEKSPGRVKHRTLQPDVVPKESRTEEEVKPAVVQMELPARTSPSRKLQENFCDEDDCPHTNSNGFRGRFCDPTCADGIPNGMNGCGAREGRHGDLCRLCYNDVDRALANDDPDDRAIMCGTMLPVVIEPSPAPTTPTCDEEDCPHMNSNGFRGRFCDPTCADGDPYGTNGCGAREGRFGELCRLCYFDMDRAIANDDPDNRAFMCDTEEPVNNYEFTSPPSRRLAKSVKDSAPFKMSGAVAEVQDAQSMFADATVLPYVNDLVRGNLCAFIAGGVNEVDQVEVAVMSVLEFLPGMTVAVAADNAFHMYQRAVGVLPGVTVHATEDAFAASLFADQYCGVDTSLIFYMKPNSVISRQFTPKDTHSTLGDLLVVHGSATASHVDHELAKQTAAVLGFKSPSFTFNTDLFLPVGANADLREVLVSGQDVKERLRHGGALEVLKGFVKMRNMSFVPQLMAALAYSRNTPGVWFIDPQTWVSQHLFRTASVWEIPLVKPRYTCSIDQAAMKPNAEAIDVGLVLQSNLDFFTHGGTCDSGYIDIRRDD